MKKTLTLLSIVGLVAAGATLGVVKVNRLMRLSWIENPPSENVSHYSVYVTGPTSAKVEVEKPPIELTNVFRDFPNGEYTVTVTATGYSANESEHSSPLKVFWYGNTPSAPSGLTVVFPTP